MPASSSSSSSLLLLWDEWFETVPCDEFNGGIATRLQLRGGDNKTLDDLLQQQLLRMRDDVTSRHPWKDLVTFLSQQQQHPVWLLNDADCCVGANPPDHYSYRLDLIVAESCSICSSIHTDDATTCVSSTTLQIAGPDASSVSATLWKLLEGLARSDDNNSNRNKHTKDITLKAFATQPRQPLPPFCLESSTKTTTTTAPSYRGIQALRFHFVALTPENAIRVGHWVSGVSNIELRQSTVADWPGFLSQLNATTQLTISCTLPEFDQFASCTLPPHVQDLSLSLHFCLAGGGEQHQQPCWSTFGDMLRQRAPHLQTLTLHYLDLTDDAWLELLASLAAHPALRSLTCQFTDRFVDAHRRLTPERRAARSRAVQDWIQNHPPPHLQRVTWPSCQHDATIVTEIDEALPINNNVRMASGDTL